MAILSGYCKSCSLCCKHPFILPEERDSIARRLEGLGRIRGRFGLTKRRLLKKVGSHFIIDADPCPFLNNGECSIEAVKPACCRVFPLVLHSSDAKSFHWAVSEECPLKRHVTAEFFRKAESEGRMLLEYHNRNVLNTLGNK